MSDEIRDYSRYEGMTINERLFDAGLVDAWDRAAKQRNSQQMVLILRNVIDEAEADRIVATVLSNPTVYGF